MKKICLITGSTSGIGLAIARILCKNNFVVINSRKPISKKFIQENFSSPENVCYCNADISNVEDVLKLKNFIVDKFGKLDWLVCNAGALPLPCGIDDITEDNIDYTIDTNLKGTFRCLKLLGRLIYDTSKNGSIVNISSIDGLVGDPYDAIYAATKAGIDALTKAFARFYGEKVRVNCVAPGIVNTPLELETDQCPQSTIDASIIKRMGTPIEIANTVAFLLSEKASFITGQIIAVDGGFTLK